MTNVVSNIISFFRLQNNSKNDIIFIKIDTNLRKILEKNIIFDTMERKGESGMFYSDFIIKEITHASIVSFRDNEVSEMNVRPWYGLAFSLGGEMTYSTQKNNLYLTESNLVFLPKNITYKLKCTKGGDFAVVNFQLVNEKEQSNFFTVSDNVEESVKISFHKLHKLLLSASANKTYEAFSCLYKMFSALDTSSSPKFSPLMDTALGYIDENLSEPNLCNAKIAEKTAVSEVYLRKLFQKYLSVSVGRYVRKARIQKAKLLLEESGATVSEIAEKCGYANVYYFSQSFKNETGCTPTQYRKRSNRPLL